MRAKARQFPFAALNGGGGGPPPPPAWVMALQAPSGAFPSVALDFANGRYWAGGAVVPVTTALVANATWGAWNPATDISAGNGWIGDSTGNGWTLADPYAAPLLGGFTSLAKITAPSASTSTSYFEWEVWDNPGFANEFAVQIFPASTALVSDAFLNAFGSPRTDQQQSITNPTKFASTVRIGAANNFAGSLNGHPVFTVGSMAMGTAVTNLSGFAKNVTSTYMALLALYAIQADSDLPAICALG